MAADSEVKIKISATHAQFAADMQKARRSVETNATGMQRAMDRVRSSFAGVSGSIGMLAGALAIGAAFRGIINAVIEQQRAVAQLEQTLKSTGRYTPELSKKLQDYAGDLQKVTAYGDEAVVAMQALLLTFTRIGGDEFNRAQMAVLDVATALGTDLKTAALQVGKALNDPVLGMTALQRSGIQFSDAQKKMVKDMIATGDVVGAQKVILKELEVQFGGSAEAARNTLGGALEGLKNAFGDLLEGNSGDDGVRGATAAIEDLTDLLADPQTVKNAQILTNAMITGFSKVLEAISTTVEFTKWLSEELASQIYGVAGDDIIRLEANLDNASAKLKKLEDSYKGVAWADKLWNKLGMSDDMVDKLRGIKSVREEVQKLQKQVDDYYAAEDAKKNKTPSGPSASPVVPVISGGTVGEAEADIKAREAAAKRRDALAKEEEAAHKLRVDTYLKDEADKWEKLEEYEKDYADKQVEFAEAYKKATMTSTEYELDQLQTKYDAYAVYIDDKIKLDEWYQGEKAKILEKTVEDEIGMIKELKDAIEGWGKDSAAAVVDFALTGKASFGDMIQSMIADLLKMMVYQSIMKPIFGAVSGMLPGGTSSTASTGGLIFGGARATGGPVSAGKMYEVNERGVPELLNVGNRQFLMMADQGGHVTAAGSGSSGGGYGGGGGEVTVNIINKNGSEVSTQQKDTPQGIEIDVMIDQAVSKKLGQFGSKSNKTLKSTYGARERLVSR